MYRFTLALASSALIFSGPAYAQHGHASTPPPTAHGQSTTHGNSGATTHGQSGSHGSSSTAHGSSTTHGSGGGNPHSDGTSTTTTNSGTTTTNTSTGSTATLTPVQQKLQQNTNLADKLRTRLPANTNLMDAAKGFKNLGQFVAAVNVSNNLGLNFTELKTHMVDDGMSLGQAIQKEKKTADVEREVHRAETEADTMIKSSTTSTATPRPFPTATSTPKNAKKTSGDK